MDWITDLLNEISQSSPHKDKLENFASEHAATKAENAILRPENKILKTENANLAAQLQTQKDKYEQLTNDFQHLAHVNSHNVWRTRSLVGSAIFAVIYFGDLTDGLEAIGKYSRIIYTNGQQMSTELRRKHAVILNVCHDVNSSQ